VGEVSIAVVVLCHQPIFGQGHTAGSLCIQVDTGVETVLFTGDHLAYSERKKGLDGFKYVSAYQAERYSMTCLVQPSLTLAGRGGILFMSKIEY